MSQYDEFAAALADAESIIVIQAENPDGDSLGSALALEEILSDTGKRIHLYCPVDVPKYLRYFSGWDRVTQDFDTNADMAIIVDTSADILLSKPLQTPGVRHYLDSHPVYVLDHHATESNLSFSHQLITRPVVATGELIVEIAEALGWVLNSTASNHLLGAILSDSLGLSTQNVTSDSYKAAAWLLERGASPSYIETKRRDFSKKSADILTYKGELIRRIEYYLDGALAVVHIPWDEIQAYSDQYNPSVLVLDEMRLVEGVELAVAIKTYPDGKLTGKLRSNTPISEAVAGYFGGGGHVYAAGFRVYESLDTIMPELLNATQKAITDGTTISQPAH